MNLFLFEFETLLIYVPLEQRMGGIDAHLKQKHTTNKLFGLGGGTIIHRVFIIGLKLFC